MNLYPYQQKGIDHLLSMPFGLPHALLADAPGTGKTVMAIEAAKQSGCKTGLIIAPAIIKKQWQHMMVKWQLATEDEIQILYGLDAHVNNHPWIVVNYDLIRTEEIRKQIFAKKFHCIIMDEAQRLKSHDTIQSKSVLHKSYGVAQNTYWKWALSGTIIPNRPVELYPLLRTMAPSTIAPYASWTQYLNRYCGGAALQGRGASHIEELTERLQPFMLRRALADVWQDMPPIIENDIYLNIPYHKHPEWLGSGSGFMYEPTERRLIAESKIPAILAYILDRLGSGVDKICVFTYHREVSEQLARALSCAKIYGGMTPNQKELNKETFLTDNNCHAIIIQIGSGGEGLDGLQNVCNEVIEAEPEWSPGKEDQAIARIMRLGQTKPVILTRLLASGSYEETIYQSNNKKRRVIEIITKPNGGSFVMAKAKTTNSEFSIEENIEIMRINMDMIVKIMQAVAANLGQPVKSMPERAAENFEKAQVAQAAGNFQPPNGQVLNPPVPIAVPQTANPLIPVQATNPLLSAAPVAALQPQVAFAANALIPPTTVVPIADANRIAFEKQVLSILQPQGDYGLKKMEEKLTEFGVNRLSDLPEQAFFQYLTAIQS